MSSNKDKGYNLGGYLLPKNRGNHQYIGLHAARFLQLIPPFLQPTPFLLQAH